MEDKELNEARKRLHEAQAGLNLHLEIFGDSLSSTHGWKNDLRGFEAIHYYLMQKHHWLPAQLKAMSLEDLRFALSEELATQPRQQAQR